MEMTMRVVVILLFGMCAILSYYAYKRRPFTSHLLGITIWCLHVIIFTTAAIFYVSDVISVDPKHLNIWSNIVRIHGGFALLAMVLYYVSRKDAVW